MNAALYEKLKGVARSKSLITYSDIAPLVGVDIRTSLGRREIGRLIAEVCAHEVAHGRPMLGSVVVRKDTGMPGDGYFEGACRLGQFDPNGRNDKRAFLGGRTAGGSRLRGIWLEAAGSSFLTCSKTPRYDSHDCGRLTRSTNSFTGSTD